MQRLHRPDAANGDVLANDDYNDRVIVIDPKTGKIVWQYGHLGVSGRAPGYLANPDGVDMAPPYSLLITHPQRSADPRAVLDGLPLRNVVPDSQGE